MACLYKPVTKRCMCEAVWGWRLFFFLLSYFEEVQVGGVARVGK